MEAIWTYHVKKLCFTKKAMKNMKRLRLLSIFGFQACADSIEYLPNNLRWFVCRCYPWESLLENFEPKKLVYLDLQSSSLRQLWTGAKVLLLNSFLIIFLFLRYINRLSKLTTTSRWTS